MDRLEFTVNRAYIIGSTDTWGPYVILLKEIDQLNRNKVVPKRRRVVALWPKVHDSNAGDGRGDD